MRSSSLVGLVAVLVCLPASAVASVPVLADATLLKKAGIPLRDFDPETGVALTELRPEQQRRLQELAHEEGRCGGFEALPAQPWLKGEDGRQALLDLRAARRRTEAEAEALRRSPGRAGTLERKPEIEAALKQVSEENLRAWVGWFSSFADRFNQGSQPNAPVEALQAKLKELVRSTPFAVSVETIAHQSTPQKSLRVRIAGKSRPKEIVVLGAHLDSINQDFWGSSPLAPGADDNASGSSNLYEALRILVQQPQPERTVEFFWYAGEESGLLGSAEIAKSYKGASQRVVAVLQLDMTLFPGSGEGTLGSMTDFTSPWLRQYFAGLNAAYIGAKIVDDQCGYGCSDHASWHRQGYPALMPFEATFGDMNHKLHTAKDLIDSSSSFRHSAMFARIALAFAMDLGNSTAQAP